MKSVRKPVRLLIVLSVLLPALVFGIVLVPLVSSRSVPNLLFWGALLGWILVAILKGVVWRWLTEREQAVLAFWSRTPVLVLLVAAVLGTLPFIVISTIARSAGWSLDLVALRSGVLLLLMLAAAVVWGLWLRIEPSLPGSPR